MIKGSKYLLILISLYSFELFHCYYHSTIYWYVGQQLPLSFPLRQRHLIFHVSVPHIHAILLVKLAQHPCRHTCYDTVIGYIAVYDCTCCHYAVLSDCDTATDCNTRAYPASVTNPYRLCIFKVMEAVRIFLRQAFLLQKRMARCRNSDICSNPDSVT